MSSDLDRWQRMNNWKKRLEKKCGQRASCATVERLRQHHRTVLDGVKWSVAHVSLTATRHNSSKSCHQVKRTWRLCYCGHRTAESAARMSGWWVQCTEWQTAVVCTPGAGDWLSLEVVENHATTQHTENNAFTNNSNNNNPICKAPEWSNQ